MKEKEGELKMKSKKLRKALALILVAVLAVAAVGCGSKSSSDSKTKGTNSGNEATVAPTTAATATTEAVTSAPTAEPTVAVKTLKIGIGNAFKPMCYLDEDGNLQGYEYETLKKLDEILPQYEFTYEATEFKNILVGLDTKTYDIAVHHYGWNAERADKYLYANVGDYYGIGYNLRIAKGSNIVINSEDDLGGLKIAVGTSSNVAYLSETYNKNHPDNKINIVYDDGTTEQQLASLNNGVYDGIYGDPFGNSLTKAAYGDIFDVAGENLFYDPTIPNGTYFIFNYGDEQLRDDLDAALQQLLDNGWEKELSIKLLGADYTAILKK